MLKFMDDRIDFGLSLLHLQGQLGAHKQLVLYMVFLLVALVPLVALEMSAWAVPASAGGRGLRRVALNLILPWCFLEMAVVTVPAK